MKSLVSILLVVGSATFTILFFTALRGAGGVGASGIVTMPSSDNIATVPSASIVKLTPAMLTPATVSSDQAVAAAVAAFHLDAGELDRGVGVVRATVSLQGGSDRQGRDCWIVTADRTIPAPSNQAIFHRLEIVVSATTGKALFAYAAGE